MLDLPFFGSSGSGESDPEDSCSPFSGSSGNGGSWKTEESFNCSGAKTGKLRVGKLIELGSLMPNNIMYARSH